MMLCFQERAWLLEHIEKQPEGMWKNFMWSFRNEAKIYGSPMFDAFWFELAEGHPRQQHLSELVAELRGAAVPWVEGKAGAAKSRGTSRQQQMQKS
jgi:hypothetical protein